MDKPGTIKIYQPDSGLQKVKVSAAQKADGAPQAGSGKHISFSLKDLMRIMKKYDASDLHIKIGTPPILRINGELVPVGKDKLLAVDCRRLVFEACTKAQQDKLYRGEEVDFAYEDSGTRFRINAFLQKSSFSASLRRIKEKIPNFEELNLPMQLKTIASARQGLALVTGPAGAGKSTTLAAVIDYINTNKSYHIITIEDPIEYIHKHKKSLITQREVGSDTATFNEGLKYCLRQDPNVILIGEMRDPESIMIAAQAAETGHLVLSTLHTPSAVLSISRILDVFSGENQKQIRLLLANNLKAVVSQRLIPRIDREGRIPATEIMIVTPTISGLILEGSVREIYGYIVDGKTEGMQTMNQSLLRLHEMKLISQEAALENSDQSTELRMMLQGYTSSTKSSLIEGDENLMSWI
jgi:twitching motility protein PilT